jgi:hypothetical protein
VGRLEDPGQVDHGVGAGEAWAKVVVRHVGRRPRGLRWTPVGNAARQPEDRVDRIVGCQPLDEAGAHVAGRPGDDRAHGSPSSVDDAGTAVWGRAAPDVPAGRPGPNRPGRRGSVGRRDGLARVRGARCRRVDRPTPGRGGTPMLVTGGRMSHHDLVQVIREFTGTIINPFDLDELLHRLMDHATQVSTPPVPASCWRRMTVSSRSWPRRRNGWSRPSSTRPASRVAPASRRTRPTRSWSSRTSGPKLAGRSTAGTSSTWAFGRSSACR